MSAQGNVVSFCAGLFLGMTGVLTHLAYWAVIGGLVVYIVIHHGH